MKESLNNRIMKYPILMADIVDSRKANQFLLIDELRKVVHFMYLAHSKSVQD